MHSDFCLKKNGDKTDQCIQHNHGLCEKNKAGNMILSIQTLLEVDKSSASPEMESNHLFWSW